MIYVEDFICRIEKMANANKIEAFISHCSEDKDICLPFINNMPQGLHSLYSKIQSLQILKPRQFEILPIKEMTLLQDRYLHFANINYTEKICFDVSNINEAEEWNIINVNNGFVITLTIGSFLTNKVWRWIDWGKEIWKEEI